MSIIQASKDAKGKTTYEQIKLNIEKGVPTDPILEGYTMSDEAKETRSLILKHFTLGTVTMNKPRVEFNDLSVILRDQADQMAFNTYQANNGDPFEGEESTAWKSRAMRPIVRNKCVSIAAHATARLIFPKIFAYDSTSQEQTDAATTMMSLMEWAADQSNYADNALYRTITALYSPASIGYTEYCETYNTVKTDKVNGVWQTEQRLDPIQSGFQNTVVPVDELYIENFFEPDVQKQGWLIWRRVMSYSVAVAKYNSYYENFKYVKPGVQLVYNDANQYFYQVYDTNMRSQDVEEIIYWNRTLDLKIIMVNGVMLTDYDNPNPRVDKLYPFDKFGYEIINNRCFYYKSLAFKMQSDANIINTLYPMIIDSSYLNLMPPMVNVGGEIIGSDVYVPGSITTLSSPDADLRAIHTSNNMKAGMDTLFEVEKSINESSQEPIQQGQQNPGTQTAYEISRMEQNAATVLGLFIKMISKHVKDFGRLRLGDILQYLTIAEVSEINDNTEMVYKTFLLPDRQSNGQSKTHKIVFDNSLPEGKQIGQDQADALSRDTLAQQGGLESKTQLYRVNPDLFRNLTYMITVSPDVLNPRSEDLERAYDLETYDKMILNPLADQEETYRLLLSSNPKTRRNPDKYISKQAQAGGQTGQPQPSQPPQTGQSQAPTPSPMAGLPTTLSTGQLQ